MSQECGCWIDNKWNTHENSIVYCPLHANAERLLEAARKVDSFFVFFDNIVPPEYALGARASLRDLRDAIAASGGSK